MSLFDNPNSVVPVRAMLYTSSDLIYPENGEGPFVAVPKETSWKDVAVFPFNVMLFESVPFTNKLIWPF